MIRGTFLKATIAGLVVVAGLVRRARRRGTNRDGGQHRRRGERVAAPCCSG